MKYTNLGEFKTIKKFIDDKLTRLSKIEYSFDALFPLMFENETNVFFEESTGYKIKKVTYKEAKENINLIAKNIRELVKNHSEAASIGIYLDNSHYWIEVFWGILKAGFKPLFMNMRLDNDSLENALKMTNAVLVISDTKSFSVKTVNVASLLKENSLELDNKFGTELFVMSSGTTNNIKICAYSAVEIINTIQKSEFIIGKSKLVQHHYDGELKLLAFLPFYHIFGFVANYLWFSFFSRTFVKLNDMNPTTIQNTILRHHVTHIFAVPLFWQKTYEAAIKEIKNKGEKTYNKFLKGIKLANKPLIGPFIRKKAMKQVRDGLFGESISFMITGGSMINKDVLTFFNSIGYHLSNGYGMSEIGITSVELSNKLDILDSASIGIPLPGIEYKIDENNELSVKSNSLASYILCGDERIITKDKWFATHDLARYENGRYYLLGREDDLVVSITGENLNPNLIEEKLMVNNINSLCLINGRENKTPILLVSVNKYLKPELSKQVIEELKTKIKENNLDQQIGKIELIAEPFIKGDEFKVNRKRVEEDYFNGGLSIYSTKNVSNDEDDEISYRIKELFATALNKPVNEISSDSDFFLDEGGTSLDYFVIVGKIQDEFEVNIASGDNQPHSVKDIVKCIKENL